MQKSLNRDHTSQIFQVNRRTGTQASYSLFYGTRKVTAIISQLQAYYLFCSERSAWLFLSSATKHLSLWLGPVPTVSYCNTARRSTQYSPVRGQVRSNLQLMICTFFPQSHTARQMTQAFSNILTAIQTKALTYQKFRMTHLCYSSSG